MRRFRRRRRGRRLNRRGFFTLVLLFCLAAAGLIEWRIHSVFSDVTYQQVQRMVTQAVEETVEEVSGQELSLVEMTQGEDGALQSLTVNSAAMNRVKSQVALGVQERLSEEHGETGIPWGPCWAARCSMAGGLRCLCGSRRTAMCRWIMRAAFPPPGQPDLSPDCTYRQSGGLFLCARGLQPGGIGDQRGVDGDDYRGAGSQLMTTWPAAE